MCLISGSEETKTLCFLLPAVETNWERSDVARNDEWSHALLYFCNISRLACGVWLASLLTRVLKGKYVFYGTVRYMVTLRKKSACDAQALLFHLR